MLVLSRKAGERIFIPGLGIIAIVKVHGDNVRIGFDFPSDVHVRREEIMSSAEVLQTVQALENDKARSKTTA